MVSVTGEIVVSVVEKVIQPAGQYNLHIDVTEFPTGMYILEFVVNDKRYFEKVVKL